MVIIFQTTSTNLMTCKSPPLLRIITMYQQVASSTKFPFHNASWISFTTFLHQVSSRRSSNLTSAIRYFRCSSQIVDGLPNLFHWSLLMVHSISSSYVTVLPMENGYMTTSMFSPL